MSAQSVRKLTVFVSSLMKGDVEAERKAVIELIDNYSPTESWAFENAPPSPKGASKYYLGRLKECDIFVVILGNDVSEPVEDECIEALKHKIPIIAFVKDVPHTPKVDALLSQLGCVYKPFQTTEHLTKELGAALTQHITEKVRESSRAAGLGLSKEPPFDPPCELPASYVERNKEMGLLRKYTVENTPNADGRMGVTAVWGMGGAGKSVLVAALCHDPEVCQAYPHGVVTVHVNKVPRIEAEQIADVACKLGDDRLDVYNTGSLIGITRLSQILASLSVLIVLDDVSRPEVVKQFRFDAPRCHLLVTTRNHSVVQDFEANEIQLGMLDEEAAIQLLSKDSQTSAPELADIARELGYHPLAIHLVAQRLKRGMTPADWLKTYRKEVAGMTTSLTALDSYEQLRISIDQSVEELKPHQQYLYNSLGVFPERMIMPKDLVVTFWQKLSPKTERAQFDDLLNVLCDLALVEADQNHLTLHDLLHDYNRHKLGDQLANRHHDLLDMFNPHHREWHHLDYDPNLYDLYKFLPYHMINAGLKEELWAEFRSAVERMEEHFEQPAPNLEGLLVRIWHAWWQNSEDSRKEAEAFLSRYWMRRRIPKSREHDYTAGTIAVRCAFEVDHNEGAAIQLCHPNDCIRTAALNHMYYLGQPGGQVESAIRILQILSNRIKTPALLPDFRALRSVLFVTPLIAMEHYKIGTTDDRVAGQLLDILRDSINRTTSHPLLRLLGPAGRTFVLRFIVRIAERMFSEARTTSHNNIEGLGRHFSEPLGVRRQTREALRYLDRTCHCEEEDMQELILRLLFSSGRMTEDRITVLIAEYIIAAHGVQRPTKVGHIIREIAARDDGSGVAFHCATHLWYAIMDRQPVAAITPEALSMMSDLVRQWLANGKHGYGVVRSMNREIQVYPLAYYAAIWTKAHPKVQIDLLDEYAKQALATGDGELMLHVAGTFGDMRQVLYDYRIPLTVLKPYVSDLQTGSPMWDKLVESLGTAYARRPVHVLDFLEEISAPAAFAAEIERFGYRKPFIESYLRIYNIPLDVFAYAPTELVRSLLDLLGKGLDQPSIGKMLATILNESVDMLNGSPRNQDDADRED